MTETKELDMREVTRMVCKKAWVVVLCAVLVGILVFTYTFCFVTAMYEANIMIYVNNGTEDNNGSINSVDLAVALRLVTTYVNILKSDTVLEKVVEDANVDLTPRQVRSMMTAEPVEETEMFRVMITAPDPQMAANIANSIADVAPAEIAAIIDGSAAKIIDYAKVPTSRHTPSYTMNTLIGVLVGALAAIAGIIVRDLLDTHVKGKDDLAKICPIPVIGLIPEISEEVKGTAKEFRPKKQ